ncbi:bis-aminopropyl spermidine synthase family protein [Nocardiopsis metallicus]|uniref:DNA-binding transcriptional ArsR family regulator n=1 Tax=Nocardiopsis metallicus TaxID=179819 RepID=A0A840WDF7_9ACTN|nr:bis-aminopropyl spermidine synthase family protein [Nocardiopsis metallicus]MBB5489326.1 DNA-binding transcriptional ArsR family regulator [Nocardiopsis metallicus]
MAGHPISPGPDETGASTTDKTTRVPGIPVLETPAAPRPDQHPPLPEAAQNFLREHGTDAPRPRMILALLSDGRWWSANDLVRASGVAYAVVSSLLKSLEEAGELVREPERDRCRLRRPAHYNGANAPILADPVAHLLSEHPRAAAELVRAVHEGPSSDLDLDHVSATAETALRRALFLATRFDLSQRTLLCVGDHDLTSLALTLVQPGARVSVVDLDERVLAHIDAVAERLGLPVRTYSADLRLGLPATLRESADLVFTDPPYTPDGVELFVRRGVEGLSDPKRGRVLVAYGASETTPKLAAATQARMVRSGLLMEAVWPDFNRYLGAESIGAASDLYVLRPLSRTRLFAGGDASRVYSQGSNAKEAKGGLTLERATAVLERVSELLGGEGAEAAQSTQDPAKSDGAEKAGRSDRDDLAAGAAVPALVGDWPREVTKDVRVRLSTWMDSPTAVGTCSVVNLTGGWERLAPRVALAATTDETFVLVPSSSRWVRDEAGQREFRSLVEPGSRVRFLRGLGAPDLTAIRLRRNPEPGGSTGRLLAHVQGRAHGTLTTTMRTGLVEVAAWRGRPTNKRTARHAVASAPGWLNGHSLLDLPEHRFSELRVLASELVARVEELQRAKG